MLPRAKSARLRRYQMVNPFDLKAAVLAKHAQHVVLIHFPIALFISAVVFDLISQWTNRRGLSDAAYYNLVGATISTLPVLATGILAWQFQLEGQKLKGILLMHLVLACYFDCDDLVYLVVTFSRTTKDISSATLSSGCGSSGGRDHCPDRTFGRLPQRRKRSRLEMLRQVPIFGS